MRHPLWAINSALLILLICALAFVFYARKQPPKRRSIRPQEYVPTVVESVAHINIEKIYTNDLFGTYTRIVEPIEVPRYVQPIPEPPEPQAVHIPEIPAPEFIDPLSITLKGVISFAGNDNKNRAIIADEETKQEVILRVGDTVEDAQLVRIFSHKVIFVRSNGQQEILYLREQDAKLDPSLGTKSDWEKIIHKKNDTAYEIIADDFIEWVTSLSQLIDLLDLTTVYRAGKSVGVRIGSLTTDSLGLALGLNSGDIVESINSIPATNTTNRLAIFKSIVSERTNNTVTVKLVRNGRQETFSYTIRETRPRTKSRAVDLKNKVPQSPRFEQEKIDLLQEKHKFAPTIQELKKQEKRAMQQNGSLLPNIKPYITE